MVSVVLELESTHQVEGIEEVDGKPNVDTFREAVAGKNNFLGLGHFRGWTLFVINKDDTRV